MSQSTLPLIHAGSPYHANFYCMHLYDWWMQHAHNAYQVYRVVNCKTYGTECLKVRNKHDVTSIQNVDYYDLPLSNYPVMEDSVNPECKWPEWTQVISPLVYNNGTFHNHDLLGFNQLCKSCPFMQQLPQANCGTICDGMAQSQYYYHNYKGDLT